VRRRALAVVAAAVAGLAMSALPAAASAQSFGFFFSSGGNARVVGGEAAGLRTTGAVTVDFHGDPAAGCGDNGLCGVSGITTWTPGRAGQLLAIDLRSDGQPYEEGLLAFGGREDPTSTAAHVQRAATAAASRGLCSDASQNDFALLSLGTQPGTSLAIGLTEAEGPGFGQSDPFRTRCAGPTVADLRGLLPTHVLTRHALRRGRRTLDFSAERPFSSHGLTGTLHSTVVMRIGRVQRFGSDQGGLTETISRGSVRRRRLEVEYAIERVSGQVVTDIRGLEDPDLCGPLDACGLMGSVTVAPRASGGAALLEATASTRVSLRDLRRAVGLAPGPPRAHGVRVFGAGGWDDDGGVATASLARGGALDCRDTEPLRGGGVLTMRFSGRRVRAGYNGPSTDPLRTRCPGPAVADVAGTQPLATATVPLSAFRSPRVTLRLTTGRSFSSDGYSGTMTPDVTVVLRRVRARSHIDVTSVPKPLRRLLPLLRPR
jgi:hypothetical protein